jgi:uncharacterized BrkB/YihY/UPF0761 family membrane protein
MSTLQSIEDNLNLNKKIKLIVRVGMLVFSGSMLVIAARIYELYRAYVYTQKLTAPLTQRFYFSVGFTFLAFVLNLFFFQVISKLIQYKNNKNQLSSNAIMAAVLNWLLVGLLLCLIEVVFFALLFIKNPLIY